MKISEKDERFDEQKVENIVKELIESGVIFAVGITGVSLFTQFLSKP